MDRALVLNASDEPLAITAATRAAALVASARAELVAAGPVPLRSPSVSVARPQVIRLRRYVRLPHRQVRSAPTLRGLRARDGELCAYCRTRPATTIDHVLPRSRGGANHWENAVGACTRCNSRKANRTPEEAGLRLSVTPRTPPSPMWLALVGVEGPDAWDPYLVHVRSA